MKKIFLFILLFFAIFFVTFAEELELASFSIKDELSHDLKFSVNYLQMEDAKFVMYFNNAQGVDLWSSITPFGLIITEYDYQKFIDGIKKFFEWEKIAKENGISNVSKDINIGDDETMFSGYHFYKGGNFNYKYLCFKYERKSNVSRLVLCICHNSRTDEYYFSSSQVERLQKVLSEQSLKNAEETINAKKRQEALFY